MKALPAIIGVACVALAAAILVFVSTDVPAEAPPIADRPTGVASPDAVRAADGPEQRAAPKREDVVAEPTSTAATNPKRMTGRVVDEHRLPIAGAAITVTKETAVLDRATSESAGRFTIAPEAAALEGGAQITIRADDGRTAQKRVWKGSPDDLGPIVLDRASPLRVHVSRDGHPVGNAMVAVDVGALREPMFDAPTDADGTVVFGAVPAGFTWVRAEHGGAVGRKRAFLPDETDIEIALIPASTFDLQVVAKDDGVPIAGAELTVAETIPLPAHFEPDFPMMGEANTFKDLPGLRVLTDKDGRARLTGFDPSGKFELRVKAAGFLKPENGQTRLVASSEPQRIELERAGGRAVRIPVVAGEVPVPAAGTQLTLRIGPGFGGYGEEITVPGPLTMGNAEIVVPAWSGQRSFIARTTDGALAKLWVPEEGDAGKDTSFVRPRVIAVHVVDAAGAPVTGARASAHNQGNNLLGDEIATDAGGNATLRDLLPELVNVQVTSPVDPGQRVAAGSVDLKQGDGAVEAVLPAVATARIKITIDGVAALPARFRIGAGALRVRVLEEIPERAELRIGVAVAKSDSVKPVKISCTAIDDLSGFAEVTPVTSGVEPIAEIALVHKARLDVVVDRPQKMRVSIGIERQDPATGAFAASGSSVGQSISYPNGPGDTFRFGGLGEGVYRATEQTTKAVSQPVSVRAGVVSSVAFMIGERKTVAGTVTAPAGTDLTQVRVILESADLAQGTGWRPAETIPDGAWVKADGAFEIPIPGDKDVVVRPWHPWLQPAAKGGRITTRAGGAGVVLALVSGQEIRLPAPNFTAKSSGWDAPPRVGVWHGPIAGEPERWLPAPLVDGELRFGGLEPGRYSLLVDPLEGLAPLAIADVDVKVGTTLLPAAAFAPGSVLRVRVITSAGLAAPHVYVAATRVGAPSYTRSINSRGESEVVLAGLGPGTFKVRLMSGSDWAHAQEREVTVDGLAESAFDFDLR